MCVFVYIARRLLTIKNEQTESSLEELICVFKAISLEDESYFYHYTNVLEVIACIIFPTFFGNGAR